MKRYTLSDVALAHYRRRFDPLPEIEEILSRIDRDTLVTNGRDVLRFEDLKTEIQDTVEPRQDDDQAWCSAAGMLACGIYVVQDLERLLHTRNLDQIADYLREAGVENVRVEMTGGGTATLFAGPSFTIPTMTGDAWVGQALVAGPGWFAGPDYTEARVTLHTLSYGLDDDGERELFTISAGDEREIADRLIAYLRSARLPGPIVADDDDAAEAASDDDALVVYSPGADRFWSREVGWVDKIDAATRFTLAQTQAPAMPLFTHKDAHFVAINHARRSRAAAAPQRHTKIADAVHEIVDRILDDDLLTDAPEHTAAIDDLRLIALRAASLTGYRVDQYHEHLRERGHCLSCERPEGDCSANPCEAVCTERDGDRETVEHIVRDAMES